MFYKKFSVLALAGALTLGGCSTIPGTHVPTIDINQVTAVISTAQNDAAKICGFVPTASTVSSIIASFIPGATPIVDIGNQVAQMICNAVAPSSPKLSIRKGRRASGPPMVGDVKVEGYFIR